MTNTNPNESGDGESSEAGAGQPTIRRGPYPEFTWPAMFIGWAIGALIAVSIGYAALILGFAIEGSELAAILGWGILRGVMRRTSIVENNINQTIASAVNGASSGIMFSVPALFILSRNQQSIIILRLSFWGFSGFPPCFSGFFSGRSTDCNGWYHTQLSCAVWTKAALPDVCAAVWHANQGPHRSTGRGPAAAF